jgi:hypothetical protein
VSVRTRTILIALLVWALGLAGLFWHLGTQQSAGDRTLAVTTLRDAAVATRIITANTTSTVGEVPYVVTEENIDLYLQSQTAGRRPTVTLHIRRIALALDAAYELIRLKAHDRPKPELASAPDAVEAAKEFPTLTRFIATGPEGQVIDNEDFRATKALVEVAKAEIELANGEVVRIWGR